MYFVKQNLFFLKGLLAPTEILKACEKFPELNLPVELKSFENGVVVIQSCNFIFQHKRNSFFS